MVHCPDDSRSLFATDDADADAVAGDVRRTQCIVCAIHINLNKYLPNRGGSEYTVSKVAEIKRHQDIAQTYMCYYPITWSLKRLTDCSLYKYVSRTFIWTISNSRYRSIPQTVCNLTRLMNDYHTYKFERKKHNSKKQTEKNNRQQMNQQHSVGIHICTYVCVQNAACNAMCVRSSIK